MVVMKYGERKSAIEMMTTASLHSRLRIAGQEWAQGNWAGGVAQRCRLRHAVVGRGGEDVRGKCPLECMPPADMYS